MKASTKRILSLLGIAVLLVAALAVYANLVRPEYRTVAELRGALSAKTRLLEDQGKVIAQVQDLLAQYQGVAQLQDTISLALPAEESVSSVFQQINAVAKANGQSIQALGLTALAIKPAASEVPWSKGLGTLRINFRLLGSYAGFKNFLRALETNIRVMDLFSLKMERAGRANQDLFFYNLVVDTYYQQ